MQTEEFLERLDAFLKNIDAAAESPTIPQLPESYSGSISWPSFRKKFLEVPRTALVLNLKEVDAVDVDRAANMLSGPFWTSEKQSWPTSHDHSWEPIIQINLGTAGEQFGCDIGGGLLQVWKSNPHKFEGYTVRYVTAETLTETRASSLPSDLVCIPERTHARRATSRSAPWAYSAILPIGWERAVSIHDELESYLECLSNDWDGPHTLVAEAEALRAACTQLSTVDGDYLFGNYYPRGYDASLDLLLAQISDKHFFWGEDGKAIVTCRDIAKPWEAEFVWFE